MTRIVLSLIFILSTATAFAQTPPLAGTNTRYRIDLNSQNLIDAGVTRLELKLDAGPFISIGMPPTVTDPLTPVGFTTVEHPVGTITPGLHTTQVQACNPFSCSAGFASLTFRMTVAPGTPGLRLSTTVSAQGIVQNRFNYGNLDVLDVHFATLNTNVLIGAPTFTIPGFNVMKNDKVDLGIWR